MAFTEDCRFARNWLSLARGMLDADAMIRNLDVRIIQQWVAHKEVAMSNEGKQVARYAALVAGSAVVGAGIGL